MPGSAPSYRFHTTWRVPGTVREVMAVLSDSASLPRWWPAVYLDVVPVADGDGDGVGRTVELTTAGWLPYTLRWTLVITYDWRVAAAKPLLARLSWLLRPVFEANHHWAMARGQESLALELRRRRDPAAEVPPPPGPTSRRRRTR